MRKELLPPLAILAAILGFTLFNSAVLTNNSSRWQTQLQQAKTQALQENWSIASELLSASYDDWTARQVYLHIVSRHDAVDAAEAMYRRAMAFALTREPTEFQAELEELSSQLRLLAEMEQFNLRNIL